MIDKFERRGRVSEDHVADLVAAYVSTNRIALSDLPALIACVRAGLAGLATGQTASTASPNKATQAEIYKSITPEALISFIDGKSYKTLKRHLSTHGLDPDGYRQRYGLPADYPLVASTYSARRSEISRNNSFGRHAREWPLVSASGRS